MRTLKIELPHLPYPELSPNWRGHWSEIARGKKVARAEAGWLALAQWKGQMPMSCAMISYEFTVKVDRVRDHDNLIASCKPLQDGLIDAGVIFYDDANHLKLGSVTISKGDKDLTTILVQEVKSCEKREKGILMSAPMMQAGLREVDPKTQTRRIMKPQPERGVICKCPGDDKSFANFEMYYNAANKEGWIPIGDSFTCRYQVGDRLYWKETHYKFGFWAYEQKVGAADYEWRFVILSENIKFPNDPPIEICERKLRLPSHFSPNAWYKRPSLFMFKKDARIWSTVLNIEAQRVQEITDSDAQSEGVERLQLSPDTLAGVPPPFNKVHPMTSTYIQAFAACWDSINGKKYPWSMNPWCWKITMSKPEVKR